MTGSALLLPTALAEGLSMKSAPGRRCRPFRTMRMGLGRTSVSLGEISSSETDSKLSEVHARLTNSVARTKQTLRPSKIVTKHIMVGEK